MTLSECLTFVDRAVARRMRQTEEDLLRGGVDPADAADWLAKQAAELHVWRGALVEVLVELCDEMRATEPRPWIH